MYFIIVIIIVFVIFLGIWRFVTSILNRNIGAVDSEDDCHSDVPVI